VRWPEARSTAHGVPSLPVVTLPLADALGSTLAERLWARVGLPAFDTAAMDGYAVRGPGPWRVVGRVLAGDPAPPPLPDGAAREVATGAAVPAGCEGVLPTEAAVRAGDEVAGEPPVGRHIRRTGEECAPLTALLEAGTAVTPLVLGLAAAVGWDALVVRPRPRVRLLVTGDELEVAGLPGAGRVRDALGPLLPGLLAALDADLLGAARIGDDRGDLVAVLAAADDADVLVTTGASARGPADHLRPALLAVGAELLVDGVGVRPGHPALLARLPVGTWVVGVPGNPLAAVAGVLTLLAPLLAGLGGRALPGLDAARAGDALVAHEADTTLVPVRRRDGVALATGHHGAAMLRGVALADGFAVVPPGPGVDAGASVRVLPLPGARPP